MEQKAHVANKEDVFTIVKQSFSTVLGGMEIDDEFSLTDSRVDSLSRVEMIMELELGIKSAYGITTSIPEQFTEGISNAGQLTEKLCTFINEKIDGQAHA